MIPNIDVLEFAGSNYQPASGVQQPVYVEPTKKVFQRFHRQPQFGLCTIPRPEDLLLRLGMYNDGDVERQSEFDLGNKSIATQVSEAMSAAYDIIEATIEEFACQDDPSDYSFLTVGEAVARFIADIAVIGIAAEATERVKSADEASLAPSYSAQLHQVLAESGILCDDPAHSALAETMNVGASVLARLGTNHKPIYPEN